MGNCVHGSHLHTATSRSIRNVAAGRRVPPTLFVAGLEDWCDPVRPVWFLWEDGAFWVLTGPWARLFDRVRSNPAVALVVDVCDIEKGLVQQVIARGDAELVPFDVPRGRRKLIRYLGADESRWDTRFVRFLYDDPEVRGTTWLRLVPDSLTAQD